jgi:putative Mg2+ transporter-C (MgtC) family protein
LNTLTISDFDVLVRMLAAAVFGGVIGLERESRDHEAGLRTHALVCAGAALFTMAGAYAFDQPGTDPMRVAAQVATGIGFIGAGAILKYGLDVRGLTTAATIWLAAAVGVVVGVGAIVAGLIGVGCSLLIVTGLRRIRHRLGDRAHVEVAYRGPAGDTVGGVLDAIGETGATIRWIRLFSGAHPDEARMVIELTSSRGIQLPQLAARLRHEPGVIEVQAGR